MRIGRFTTKQKVLVGAAAAVLAAGALIVVWAGEDDAETVAGPDTTLEHEATTTSTTIPTTTTAVEESTTTPTDGTTSTAPRGPVPDQPTDVRARPSAGSGEISVYWGPVARATGYRVLRSATAGGRFVVIVDMNVTTGATTKAAGVTTIWSANHNYGLGRPRLATPDTWPWFEVIDVGNDPRWFKLVAYNAAGPGPASAVLYSVPSYPPQPLIPPQTSETTPTTLATVPVPPPGLVARPDEPGGRPS
jgi:hypothetical protein